MKERKQARFDDEDDWIKAYCRRGMKDKIIDFDGLVKTVEED